MQSTGKPTSAPTASIYLGLQLPAASSGQPGALRRRANTDPHKGGSPSIWPCSGRGLASRCVSTPLVRSYRTISPLVAWWRPVCFCATFRRVTPPGCYPAPCPVEHGLSSAARPKADDRGRSAHSRIIVAYTAAIRWISKGPDTAHMGAAAGVRPMRLLREDI